MGWEYDQPPINYLKRRVKYYKKKIGSTRSIAQVEGLIKKYGEKKLQILVDETINNIQGRIAEFEKAIKLLEDATKRTSKI